MCSKDIKKYQKRTITRNTAVVFICFSLLILSALISMNTGYSRLSAGDIQRIVWGGGNANENLILFQFRLPRIVKE